MKQGKVLVAGWFSFEDMGATAGDLLSKNIIGQWLQESGLSFDVALAESFAEQGCVDWKLSDPSAYTMVIFVCGPFGNGSPVAEMLERFGHCQLVGVNLSLLQPLSEWNPFSLLLERDSSLTSFPDLTFYGKKKKVPVVGIILAHKQKEYGAKSLHDQANAAINRLIARTEMSAVPIDTSLKNNAGGLRTAAEIESLIAAMDVVITTRLHGTVLALKNGVPVVAIDPVAGGAKISLQTKTIGWPVLLNTEHLSDETLAEALGYCLTDEAVLRAQECTDSATLIIGERKKLFIDGIRTLTGANSPTA